MTWSYNNNQPGTLDRIRWIIGDTDNDRQLIQDEEINAVLLRQTNNLLRSAIEVAEHLEAKFVRRAESRSGEILADFLTVALKYRELAKRLKKQGVKGFSMIEQASRDSDLDNTNLSKPLLSVGMFDNKTGGG